MITREQKYTTICIIFLKKENGSNQQHQDYKNNYNLNERNAKLYGLFNEK